MTQGGAQFTAVLILLANAPGLGVAATCTQQQGSAAEDAVDHLDTWARIYDAFRRFANCDNGGVAEGFSDRVVHLLSTKWAQLPELNRYAEWHPNFKTFVVHHIDATADTDELKNIEVLAASHCPRTLKKLCVDLHDAAASAIKESS